MKKLLVLLLTVVFILSMSGCQQGMEALEKLENIELPPLPEPTEEARAEEETTRTMDDTDAVTVEETPSEEPVSYVTLEMDNRVTVNIGRTRYEEYDPEKGAQLILAFSYETPHVSIQGRNEAALKINDYFSMLDETYYTGNDYGAGTAMGFNAMLEFAQDHYDYIVHNSQEFDMYFSANRIVSVTRADDTVLSVLYDDYEYTGGVHGGQLDRAYLFDTRTGERLSLESLSDDAEALSSFLVDYMVDLTESEPDYYQRIDLTIAEASLGAAEIEDICKALLREGSWYLDLDGMVIFADQYEIGAGVAGMIEFHIPYGDLSEAIDAKWLPADKSAQGRFTIRPMSEVEDGTVEILDFLSTDSEGESYCVLAEGAVYDVRVSNAQYTNSFYETGLLWCASHMSGCAIQLQATLPEGMPELMISYTSGGERHSVLLGHGEEGGVALVDDTIEAVG